MKDITLKNADQIGARIRFKRKEKGLSQTALASLLGVERKWVLRLEAGNPKAELGLVLRALRTLGIELALQELATPSSSHDDVTPIAEAFRRLNRQGRK